MHVNNLNGPRMPTTTTAERSSATARTGFSTLVSGSAGIPVSAPSGAPTGSRIVSTAIASQGVPGSGFGAPYMQAMSAGVPGTGVPGTGAPSAGVPGTGLPGTATQPGAPRAGALPVHNQAPQAPGTPTVGSEFNGELQQMYAQQKEQQEAMLALREIMKMSLMSFMGASFNMGMNRPKMEFATAEE